MTGYNSKRQMSQDKLNDDDDTQVYADTLLIVYQRGFADGKRSAQRKQQAEPSQWRDMVVVSLVREGINKHRARELADHFAAQQQAEPFAWVFTPNNDLLWPHEVEVTNPIELNSYQPLYTAPPQQQAKMRMPKVGDKVICLEDESLGEVVSLTAGGSPDITFDDGTRGTYLLREFAELFGYVAPPQQQSEPPPERPWVGLTDEEIEAVVEQVANGKLVGTVQEFRIRFSRAIEAKLKEKNT